MPLLPGNAFFVSSRGRLRAALFCCGLLPRSAQLSARKPFERRPGFGGALVAPFALGVQMLLRAGALPGSGPDQKITRQTQVSGQVVGHQQAQGLGALGNGHALRVRRPRQRQIGAGSGAGQRVLGCSTSACVSLTSAMSRSRAPSRSPARARASARRRSMVATSSAAASPNTSRKRSSG